jgi:hypothetical protein
MYSVEKGRGRKRKSFTNNMDSNYEYKQQQLQKQKQKEEEQKQKHEQEQELEKQKKEEENVQLPCTLAINKTPSYIPSSTLFSNRSIVADNFVDNEETKDTFILDISRSYSMHMDLPHTHVNSDRYSNADLSPSQLILQNIYPNTFLSPILMMSQGHKEDVLEISNDIRHQNMFGPPTPINDEMTKF